METVALHEREGHLAEFVAQLQLSSTPATISINGRPNLVVEDSKSFRMLIELVDRLETIASLRRSVEDVRVGRTFSLEEFKEEVRTKHGISP